MKNRCLIFLLVCIILFNSIILANAKNYSGVQTCATVNGTEHSFVLNEYFSENYDRLFEKLYVCPVEKQFNIPLLEHRGNSSDLYYVMVYFNEEMKSDDITYYDFNMALLNNISDYYKKIVYIGTTTPCVVVLIENNTEYAMHLLEQEEVMCLYEAFEREGSLIFTSDLYMPENTPITAADARKVLRVAAKLDSVTVNARAFYCYFDFNLDNKLNAADARLVLRVSAKLEKSHSFKGGERKDWLVTDTADSRGF